MYVTVARTPIGLAEYVDAHTPPAAGIAGLPLFNCLSFKVYLDPIGGNLAGAGTLRAWHRDGGVTRRMPELDISLSVANDSGSSGRASGDLEVLAKTGEVVYQTDGVTQSAGTTCTLTIKGRVHL